MSKSKNYNSIVFLTTLSVCLGFLMVGAVPPVPAQSVENEKVFQISSAQTLYGNAILELVKELEKLSAEKKYKFSEKINLVYDFDYFEKSKQSGSLTFGKRPKNWKTFRTLWTAAEKISRNLTLLENEFSEQKGEKLAPFNVSISLEESGLTISANRAVSNNFSGRLINRFEKAAAAESDSLGLIYRHTKISSENNQVFIVTRLPRASIDDLSAEHDAQ